VSSRDLYRHGRNSNTHNLSSLSPIHRLEKQPSLIPFAGENPRRQIFSMSNPTGHTFLGFLHRSFSPSVFARFSTFVGSFYPSSFPTASGSPSLKKVSPFCSGSRLSKKVQVSMVGFQLGLSALRCLRMFPSLPKYRPVSNPQDDSLLYFARIVPSFLPRIMRQAIGSQPLLLPVFCHARKTPPEYGCGLLCRASDA